MSIYIFATTKKIHTELGNHTEESRKITGEVNKIKDGITVLEDNAAALRNDFKDFGNLYDNYIHIESTKPTITKFKKQIVRNVDRKIDELRYQNRISNLPPEDSFDLSTPMLRNLQSGDEVLAVSFLENDEGEWESNILWSEYIEAHTIAAKKGVSVERIFITDPTELANALQKMVVAKKHTEEQFGETGLKGFFLDIRTYMAYPADLKGILGQGFILIISNSTEERMVVRDHFYQKNELNKADQKHLDYRTTVSFNKNEIDDIELFFRRIHPKLNSNLPRLSMKNHSHTYNQNENK